MIVNGIVLMEILILQEHGTLLVVLLVVHCTLA